MLQHAGHKTTGTILIRGARQLLTLRGPRGPRRGADLADLGIIHDGAVLIRNGVLLEVGPTRRVENLADARGAVEVNAVGRILMPGFVDCHTHLCFPPPGCADQASAIRAVHGSSARLLAARARAYLESMARHGTTTVEIKTGCGLDEAAEIKVLRAIASLRLGPLDVLPTFLCRFPDPSDADDTARTAIAARVVSDFLPRIQRLGLALYADLAWDPDLALYPFFLRYLEAARLLGFACHIHAAPVWSPGAVFTAVESRALSIAHAEQADAAEIALLARSHTVATLLPCAVFSSGAPIASARHLVAGGAAIALASNFNPRLTPMLSMQTAISLACLQMKLTPAEAISAATINAAHALGRADRAGSLEAGKPADLLLLNISDHQDLAHHLGMNLVHLTMKRGQFIYQEGHVASRPPGDLDPRRPLMPD